MKKIFFKDTLIAETNCNDVKEIVDLYIAKAAAEIKPLLDKIKVIENMVDDLYPKRPKDTDEEYLAFLRKMNPEFIEALEDLGLSVFGNCFLGLYILVPNTVGTLLVYMTNEKYEDKVCVAALRNRLKNQIPSRRNIKIQEE